MPTYVYDCPTHGTHEEWQSIHADSSTSPCPTCNVESPKVLVPPNISISATPNKADDARATVEMESRWDTDMPAYKRLRANGLQPRSIDGAAELEQRAVTRQQIEMGKMVPPEAIEIGNEISSEMLQRDVTEAGRGVGEWFRGEKKAVEVQD